MGVGAHRRNERILVSHRHLDRQQAAGHVLQRGRASLGDGHRLRGSVGRGFACIGRRGRVDRQRVDTHGQFDLFRAVAVKEVRVRRAVLVGHRYRLAVRIEDFDRVGFNVGVARRPGRGFTLPLSNPIIFLSRQPKALPYPLLVLLKFPKNLNFFLYMTSQQMRVCLFKSTRAFS